MSVEATWESVYALAPADARYVVFRNMQGEKLRLVAHGSSYDSDLGMRIHTDDVGYITFIGRVDQDGDIATFGERQSERARPHPGRLIGGKVKRGGHVGAVRADEQSRV